LVAAVASAPTSAAVMESTAEVTALMPDVALEVTAVFPSASSGASHVAPLRIPLHDPALEHFSATLRAARVEAARPLAWRSPWYLHVPTHGDFNNLSNVELAVHTEGLRRAAHSPSAWLPYEGVYDRDALLILQQDPHVIDLSPYPRAFDLLSESDDEHEANSEFREHVLVEYTRRAESRSTELGLRLTRVLLQYCVAVDCARPTCNDLRHRVRFLLNDESGVRIRPLAG